MLIRRCGAVRSWPLHDEAHVPLSAARLLRCGYFPKELPPSFVTSAFADQMKAVVAQADQMNGPTECVTHSLARVGGTRRRLGVPNPRSFVLLARELQRQWKPVAETLGRSNLAISRPVLTRAAGRAIRPRYSLRERPHRRVLAWPGSRCLLRTDISQFYASIYTHAIPWAIHTRSEAKRKRGKTRGDKIDKAVRDCAAGQTAGIPIGPDSSLVIAEVILAAVDHDFEKAHGVQRGFRFLDDYELAYETRSEAEEGLARLEQVLGKYELILNPYKTEIVDLPQPYDDTWTTELAKLPIRSDGFRRTATDLVALYSRAAELSAVHPGALAYAVTRTREVSITRKNWSLLQSLAWGAASVEPTATARVLDLLAEKSEEVDSTVTLDVAIEVLEAMIRQNAPVGNASEIAWAIWSAISLGAPLSNEAASLLSTADDDFVALLALDAANKGLISSGALDLTHWEELVRQPETLDGNHWLLAYEGAVSGWLPTAEGDVAKHRFFKTLSAYDVRFYDSTPEHEPFTGPTAPLPGTVESYG
jgi:hypothetical protein